MGASTWTYYTPHDPDPGAALERLRQEVFARGEYQKPGGGFQKAGALRKNLEARWRISGTPSDPRRESMLRAAENMLAAAQSGSDAALTPQEKAWLNHARVLKAAGGYISWLRPARLAPVTIEELLEEAAEDGTHSILDVTRVTSRRGYGAAAPLAKKTLQEAFGSLSPTREETQAGDWSFLESLKRWQAVYFVVYKDGEPAEYCFAGCSGD